MSSPYARAKALFLAEYGIDWPFLRRIGGLDRALRMAPWALAVMVKGWRK